jgi:hypothetical protein
MTGTMAYPAAVLLILVAAAVYHGVTEHYWHLRYFWRYARPGIVIPETRHDTRWHAMGHAARWAYDAGMLIAAGFLGTAWRLEPRFTVYAVAAVTVTGVVWLGARTLSRTFGERRHTRDWAAAAHHRETLYREEDYS